MTPGLEPPRPGAAPAPGAPPPPLGPPIAPPGGPGGPAPPPPEGGPTGAQPGPSPGRTRAAAALVGFVLAALVAGAVYVLVIRDDDDGEVLVPAGRSTVTAPSATQVTVAATTATPAPVATGTQAPLPSVGLSTTVPVGVLPPGTPMDFVGGVPALDALANACYAGDMESCDDLYRQSDTDSPYERYGDTCAGRQPPNSGRFCTSVFPSATTTTSTGATSTSTSTTVG